MYFEENNYKTHEQKIRSYLKIWKKIEKLLLKEPNNHKQEKAISEYILRLYNKQSIRYRIKFKIS